MSIVALFAMSKIWKQSKYPSGDELIKNLWYICIQFSSVAQSYPTLWTHRLQYTILPCPSPTPRVYSNSCPLSQWYHPTLSFSVVPFSSCLQSFPALKSFPMSQFFTSDGQSIGASASAPDLPIDIQCLFPLGWTGLISLLSKGLSRVSSSTTALEVLLLTPLYK